MDIDSSSSTPAPLPSAEPVQLGPNVVFQPPLSRRGKGPPLLILIPSEIAGLDAQGSKTKTLDPQPLRKWAEEGFAVIEGKISQNVSPEEQIQSVFELAFKALSLSPECQFDGKVGVIVYELNLGVNNNSMRILWRSIWNTPEVVAVVSFSGQVLCSSYSGQFTTEAPLMVHSAGNLMNDTFRSIDTIHEVESAASTNFVLPGHEHYEAGAAGVAHTRSLGFLKKHLSGPIFDLEAIWDEHTLFEFKERDVMKTMGTMVEEPYVNHVPTMTGGVGRKALTAFYRDHFIFNNPEDTTLELVSRTVGVDRVIDEFIFSFTHDRVIDWMIPGIPPTNKHCRIPFTSVVNIRGDRLYHEHIAWDQATLLRQLGLLPEYLPYPYSLPDSRTPAKGKRFEYRVPTAGIETAMKLVSESSVESNHMFGFDIREVDDV